MAALVIALSVSGCGTQTTPQHATSTSVRVPTTLVPPTSTVTTTVATTTDGPSTTSEPPTTALERDVMTAIRELLAQLEINDSPVPQTRYRRDDWPTWLDITGDGCDAREKALIADAIGPVQRGSGCKIIAGSWTSPYDGVSSVIASDFDIDHIVPLAEAHRSGGWRWEAQIRAIYANDPDGLVVTSAHSNRSKGDRGPDQWRPQNRDHWCAYASKWVGMKLKYRLTVTSSERDALGQMLETCPTAEAVEPLMNPIPTPAFPTVGSGTNPPTDPSADQPAGAGSVYYKNCTEARAAGAAPIYRGQPGYGAHLDRDSDGIACE